MGEAKWDKARKRLDTWAATFAIVSRFSFDREEVRAFQGYILEALAQMKNPVTVVKINQAVSNKVIANVCDMCLWKLWRIGWVREIGPSASGRYSYELTREGWDGLQRKREAEARAAQDAGDSGPARAAGLR